MLTTPEFSQENSEISKFITLPFHEQFYLLAQNLHKIHGFNKDSLEKMLSSIMSSDEINFGIGSMFAAFMGDSLVYSSYHQRRGDEPKYSIFYTVMEMPGGGTWKVKPAQFTDDSELASHLLEALLSSYDPKQSIEPQTSKIMIAIAQEYVTWFKSEPFDIGATIMKGLKILKNHLYELKIQREEKQEQGIANQEIQAEQHKRLQKAFIEIQHVNKNSESNGSLMRITPMAYFISLLLQKPEYSEFNVMHFEKFIEDEVKMTHGNEEVMRVSFVWVELLVELILRKKKNRSLSQIYENFIEKYKHDNLLKDWINDSINQEWLDAVSNQGWARLAFTYGIKTLKILSQAKQQELCEKDYESLIREVVQRGGDSDTNGCIVGGLIGAVIGYKKLPVKYLKKQFELELDEDDKSCSNRGPFYEPKLQFYKAFKLLDKVLLT